VGSESPPPFFTLRLRGGDRDGLACDNDAVDDVGDVAGDVWLDVGACTSDDRTAAATARVKSAISLARDSCDFVGCVTRVLVGVSLSTRSGHGSMGPAVHTGTGRPLDGDGDADLDIVTEDCGDGDTRTRRRSSSPATASAAAAVGVVPHDFEPPPPPPPPPPLPPLPPPPPPPLLLFRGVASDSPTVRRGDRELRSVSSRCLSK
jgi:hypothetical protein